jgi:hypothetical protein
MARTLLQARNRVRGLAGLTKATPDEVDELLNEGHKELCARSEWLRARVSIGSTVANEADYALPASVYKPLKVYVDGALFSPTDEDEVDGLTQSDGGLTLASRGLWELTQDAAGAEFVTLYPPPGTAGLAITSSAVVYPDDLEDDGDPFRVPDDFFIGPVNYAFSKIYGGTEDNTDLAEYYEQKFENTVTRLGQHRRSRRGHGEVRMRIEGWTA